MGVKSDPTGPGERDEPSRGGHRVGLGRGSSVTYLPIPDELRGIVLTIFHFVSDRASMRDMFPAMPGFISFALKGSSFAVQPDGSAAVTHPASIVAPTVKVTPIGTAEPFHSAGAVLSPIGWAVLTGLSASEHIGQLFNAAEILGPHWDDFAQSLSKDYAASNSLPADFADRLAVLIRAGAHRIDDDHAALIRTVNSWLGSSLDPPLDDLFSRTVYSERQVQRLVERYFGCAPKKLVRMFRALRVFAMLHSPDLTDEQIAEVIDLYYDQSHLIREFKQFIGRTPRQLQQARMPVLSEVTAKRNYRAIWPEEAGEPDD